MATAAFQLRRPHVSVRIARQLPATRRAAKLWFQFFPRRPITDCQNLPASKHGGFHPYNYERPLQAVEVGRPFAGGDSRRAGRRFAGAISHFGFDRQSARRSRGARRLVRFGEHLRRGVGTPGADRRIRPALHSRGHFLAAGFACAGADAGGHGGFLRRHRSASARPVASDPAGTRRNRRAGGRSKKPACRRKKRR